MQLWSLCTSEGAGVYFEPYCGSHTQIHDAGLGQGPNVVLDLLGKANLAPGSEVFFDNLFTSFPLLEKLSGVYSTLLVSHRSRKSLINNLFFNISELGIAGTGTVRQNRINKIPIIDKKEMEKKTVERGTMEAIFKDDQVLYLSIEFCFCILIFFYSCQVLCAWKDSKAVYVASNKYSVEDSAKVRWFCRKQRKELQVNICSKTEKLLYST